MSRTISTYGVEADERQQLDHYRAGDTAFRVLLGALAIAYVASWFLGDDTVTLTLGALFLIGINVHALLIEASGWPRYVREELARRPDARRRAQRKLMGSVLLGTAMIFTYQHVADGEPIAKSALQAVTFGVVMTVFCWWNELRGTRPTTRRDEPI